MVISVGIFGLDRASEICEIYGSDRASEICEIFRGVARHGLGAYQGQLCHNDAPAARNAGTRGGGSAIRPLAASLVAQGQLVRFCRQHVWAAAAVPAVFCGGILGLLEGSFAAAPAFRAESCGGLGGSLAAAWRSFRFQMRSTWSEISDEVDLV